MVRTIAIGSTNPAKVRSVRQAVSPVWPQVELTPVAVESGVSDMPASNAEGIQGALQRARLSRQVTDADLGVGLEGAVDDAGEPMYLCNWAAIVDREGRTSVASGGRLPLPNCLAREIRTGAELGPVIDRYSGQADSKQHDGAAGFLTLGSVPRELVFRVAVAFALAPFLRPELYDRATD